MLVGPPGPRRSSRAPGRVHTRRPQSLPRSGDWVLQLQVGSLAQLPIPSCQFPLPGCCAAGEMVMLPVPAGHRLGWAEGRVCWPSPPGAVFRFSELCTSHSGNKAPWPFIFSGPHVALPTQVINYAGANVASWPAEINLLGATSVRRRVRMLTRSISPVIAIMRRLCESIPPAARETIHKAKEP